MPETWNVNDPPQKRMMVGFGYFAVSLWTVASSLPNRKWLSGFWWYHRNVDEMQCKGAPKGSLSQNQHLIVTIKYIWCITSYYWNVTNSKNSNIYQCLMAITRWQRSCHRSSTSSGPLRYGIRFESTDQVSLRDIAVDRTSSLCAECENNGEWSD